MGNKHYCVFFEFTDFWGCSRTEYSNMSECKTTPTAVYMYVHIQANFYESKASKIYLEKKTIMEK